jgi:hypothetical protein
MEEVAMHPAARARALLARHPLAYWITIALLAAAIGFVAHDRLRAVERARAEWGTARSVLVAEIDHRPGDELRVRSVELPLAALPPRALAEVPDGATLRQRLLEGEVLVAADLAAVPGPAARADVGQAVVGVSDPMAPGAEVGAVVEVVAEGIVLAERGVVVELIDEVVFVAVPAERAPAVAAAAQQRLASLVFVP